MGSRLVVREHSYADHAALRRWVAAECNQDAYAMGHEYSGGWNMCPGLSIFDRPSAGAGLAVQISDFTHTCHGKQRERMRPVADVVGREVL